jgi:hypothetical protein
MKKSNLFLGVVLTLAFSGAAFGEDVIHREDHRHFVRKGDGKILVYEEIFALGENRRALAVNAAENLQFLKEEQASSPNRLGHGFKIELQNAKENRAGSAAADAIRGELQQPNLSSYGYIAEHDYVESEMGRKIKERIQERGTKLCEENNKVHHKGYLSAVTNVDGYFGMDSVTMHNSGKSFAVISLVSEPGVEKYVDPIQVVFVSKGAVIPKAESAQSRVIQDLAGILKPGETQPVVIPNFTFKKLWCARNATLEEIVQLGYWAHSEVSSHESGSSDGRSSLKRSKTLKGYGSSEEYSDSETSVEGK